jgi:hypothetical protein
VKSRFGDDALAYCTGRMDPETTRLALAAAEGAGHPHKQPCPLCDPVEDPKGKVLGCLRHFVLIRVVGAGLTLPVVARPTENHTFWPPPCARGLTASLSRPYSRRTTTASRSGMRMTSPLGKPLKGPPCACCVTANTNQMARWSKPMPSPARQHPDRMAADRTGPGDRAPVPVALSAPRRPWRSLRHGLVQLSLVERGFRRPTRHRLKLAPCGRQAALRCSLTTRPLSRGATSRQEPAAAQRPAGTLPSPRLRLAPPRRSRLRGTSETAGACPTRTHGAR